MFFKTLKFISIIDILLAVLNNNGLFEKKKSLVRFSLVEICNVAWQHGSGLKWQNAWFHQYHVSNAAHYTIVSL